jgi:hypothetical protein
MPKPCSAVTKSTGANCHKRALPGSRYCLFHVDRGPLLLSGILGAILSLIVSEGYRAVVPSAESRQLNAARQETSELKRVFTEREKRLGSKMDTLVKGNETLQKLLDPFKRLATRTFPQMETEAALAKLAQEVELQRKTLNVIQRYTQISKLNVIGTTGTVAPPLKEETGVSRMLEGTFTVVNDRASYSCDSNAIAKFQEVIAKVPDFPFSYYAMAFCLRQRGDTSWKDYAMKAVDILENTTTMDGHHPSHDQILRELKLALHR